MLLALFFCAAAIVGICYYCWTLPYSTYGPDAAPAIAQAKQAFFLQRQGGIIFVNAQNGSCVALEFMGPAGPRKDGIEVDFARTDRLPNARRFLRGEEFVTFQLEPRVFAAFSNLLLSTGRWKGLTDVNSGCKLFTGVLK